MLDLFAARPDVLLLDGADKPPGPALAGGVRSSVRKLRRRGTGRDARPLLHRTLRRPRAHHPGGPAGRC